MEVKKTKIVVVGSFMMDLVIKAERRPRTGETLIGESFGMFVGGKGCNQAIIASRLGADVTMVGRLGEDLFGDSFMETLEEEKIDSRFVVRDSEVGTGVGSPVIDAQGDNSIIAIPLANMHLSVEDIDRAESALSEADILLLQLEVPVEASLQAAKIVKSHGGRVILNPAPALEFPDNFLDHVDLLTPNETETEFFTGIKVVNQDTAMTAAKILIDKGVEAVILTLGDQGALLLTNEITKAIPAYEVDVVDTTAAGDAFCGALAVAMSRGDSIESAIVFANAAGALATTTLGAAPSMATDKQISRFLAEQQS
ncbi:MAG: ribokinase [Candidatus Poribacteria bacterium]|nr:ribokinase [Candidatus Poribacteria bacterium]